MNVEERIAILEMAYTFKDKFAPVELEDIPIYYTISDNEEFINWKEEAKEVLRSCGKYVPAQESIELLDYLRPMNELDDYKDLCAHIRVVIKHLKDTNRVADNTQVSDKPTVFISYNRKSGGSFVDTMVKALGERAVFKRDSECIRPWESIRSFMNSIQKQDFVILVITDEYLKSDACMYEVIELMKDECWFQKAMFAVLDGTHIYSPSEKAYYIGYWKDKRQVLEAKANNLSVAEASSLGDDLSRYMEITNKIGAFLTKVADSNNPRQSDIVEKVIEHIERNFQNG